MTTSEQEVNVLYALHKEKYLCSKEGCRIEDVLLMVQRPNFAVMKDAPSRSSGVGNAKITLGLQIHFMDHAVQMYASVLVK